MIVEGLSRPRVHAVLGSFKFFMGKRALERGSLQIAPGRGTLILPATSKHLWEYAKFRVLM